MVLAEDGEAGFEVGLAEDEEAVELVDAAEFLVVEPDEDVVDLDAGFGGGGIFFDGVDHDAGALAELVEAGDAFVDGDVLAGDADVAATDAALLDEPAGDEFGGFAADGEADALGGGDDGGVDADDLGAGVEEGAAGVAGVEGGVGLEDVVDEAAGAGGEGAAEGADDAGGDGVFEAEGIADGDGDLADVDFAGIAEGEVGEIREIDAEDGEVGVGVVADDFGAGFAEVGGLDADFVGAVDDVAVGHDEAVGGDEEAGAAAAGAIFGAGLDVEDGGAGLPDGGDDGVGVGVEELVVGGRVGRTAGGVAVGLAEDRVHRADYAHVG